MQELWKLVTSPRHLMVFEAAARQGSFTRAAQEMNVQQPAVSASIRQLEEALGVRLFRREHKRVELTEAGRKLAADVTGALDRILVSAQSIQQKSRLEHVTLNASSAFNYYWLMPRLADLHARHPGLDLRLQNSDREPDIDAEGISLAIRRGDGNWPGCEAALIAPERIYPIASPQVMRAAVNLKTVPNLLHERLIHLEEPVRERPSWRDWFRYHHIPDREPQAGLRLNDYALVLQAAMAGEGFAFGWHHVCQGLVRRGLLAAREDWAWETGVGFWLVWSKHTALTPQAGQVRDWILEIADGAARGASPAGSADL